MGTGNFSFFLEVSEPVSEKFGTWKSLGTGIGKIWYRKKSRNRYRKYLVPKKVPVSFDILGTSHTAWRTSNEGANIIFFSSVWHSVILVVLLHTTCFVTLTHWLKFWFYDVVCSHTKVFASNSISTFNVIWKLALAKSKWNKVQQEMHFSFQSSFCWLCLSGCTTHHQVRTFWVIGFLHIPLRSVLSTPQPFLSSLHCLKLRLA